MIDWGVVGTIPVAVVGGARSESRLWELTFISDSPGLRSSGKTILLFSGNDEDRLSNGGRG